MENADCGCCDGDFGPPTGENLKVGPGFEDRLAEVDPREDKELGDDRRAPTRELPDDIRRALLHRGQQQLGD
jgi:hypothetical protein